MPTVRSNSPVYLFQICELPVVVKDLADGRRTWEDVLATYPLFEQQEATK